MWATARCLEEVPNGGAMLGISAQWAQCFEFALNGWRRDASMLRPMAGGAMLGLRARWLVAQCLDIAPDSWRRDAWISRLMAVQCLDIPPDGWRHDAWIYRPMAGGAMLGYRPR
jgi:hypothetical protein